MIINLLYISKDFQNYLKLLIPLFCQILLRKVKPFSDMDLEISEK